MILTVSLFTHGIQNKKINGIKYSQEINVYRNLFHPTQQALYEIERERVRINKLFTDHL